MLRRRVPSKEYSVVAIIAIILALWNISYRHNLYTLVATVKNHGQDDELTSTVWNSKSSLTGDLLFGQQEPTLYFCHPNNNNGMREMKKMMGDVLPEYKQVRDLHLKDRPYRLSEEYFGANFTNKYDVFIGHFDEFCLPSVERWLHTHFEGQIVLFSGESHEVDPVKDIDRNKNMHAFGPIRHEREGDMVLYYFQLTWWFYFREEFTPENMTNAERRPRGNRTNFMIYANSNCVDFREEAVGRLSEIGQVHCDGKCQGATPPSENRTNLVKTNRNGFGTWWDNINVFSRYKFCFVMEHHPSHPSYITEKILMAFIAGCVPIYYGPEAIFDIFNSKSFVFYNISDPQPALDLVAALENDEALYEEMMSEPIVANGNKTIEDYFSFSDDVGGGLKKKEMRQKLGLPSSSIDIV